MQRETKKLVLLRKQNKMAPKCHGQCCEGGIICWLVRVAQLFTRFWRKVGIPRDGACPKFQPHCRPLIFASSAKFCTAGRVSRTMSAHPQESPTTAAAPVMDGEGGTGRSNGRAAGVRLQASGKSSDEVRERARQPARSRHSSKQFQPFPT
jgi:hypothetical protein